MSNLSGKKFILGVSGSIAAYKSVSLVRLLLKAGAEVRVLMTPNATEFVGAITFSSLTHHPVHTSVIDAGQWANHVEMGLWADAMILAPVTASTLAKLATGQSDNIVVATYLSARCPVFFAPAMDLDMWDHPSVQHNIRLLQSYGNHLIPVGHGELASGLIGNGRMAEPESIVSLLDSYFGATQRFKGKKYVLTAGPTHEAIDPVRFIGNHSTGKMGIAIAEALVAQGAEVTLVLGPTALRPSDSRVQVVTVQSAQEMYEAVAAVHPTCDGAILAAAVADYRAATISDQKIKKKDAELSISLARTIDIAGTIGQSKQAHQVHIGFALETEQEAFHAKGKLERKNFDMIVLNSLNDKGAGFGHDTNKVTFFFRDGRVEDLPLQSKKEVALHIVEALYCVQNKG